MNKVLDALRDHAPKIALPFIISLGGFTLAACENDTPTPGTSPAVVQYGDTLSGTVATLCPGMDNVAIFNAVEAIKQANEWQDGNYLTPGATYQIPIDICSHASFGKQPNPSSTQWAEVAGESIE